MCLQGCRLLLRIQAMMHPKFQTIYLRVVCHRHSKSDREESQYYAVRSGRLEQLGDFGVPFEDHLPPASMGLRPPHFAIVEFHQLIELVELGCLLIGDLALITKEVDRWNLCLFIVSLCHQL